MCEYEWNKQSTLKLITIYKNYRLLWDPRHNDYKNKLARHKAIREISELMNIETNEIERKFRNLLSHYLREMKRERLGKSTRKGNSYTSKWFAFKELEFLKDRPRNPKRKRSAVTIEEPDLLQIRKEEVGQDSDETTASEQNSIIFETNPSNVKLEDPLVEYSNSSNLVECSTINDDPSTFGDYIANKVRNMDKKTRAIVEYEINSIIFKAEMGYYNDKRFDFIE